MIKVNNRMKLYNQQILIILFLFYSDSPVLWIRLDPDMTLMRAVHIEQPDYQWQYQLRHERDVTAQLEAIVALQNHSTPATRLALTDTIENEHCYYKVRLRAAHCLTKVLFRFYVYKVTAISSKF